MKAGDKYLVVKSGQMFPDHKYNKERWRKGDIWELVESPWGDIELCKRNKRGKVYVGILNGQARAFEAVYLGYFKKIQ